MYSGTTIRVKSGRVIGAHQRIDRLARKALSDKLKKSQVFPGIKDILHFEGLNGPDGIKRKSPSKDEPWHYIKPNDPTDRVLMNMINDHIHNLATALGSNNYTRAAFEAAWLAHAVVDGLTPAHHYPLADKIHELWGKPHHERTSVRDKNLIRGRTVLETVAKNWEYWGHGGVFTSHVGFEWGFAMAISTTTYSPAYAPTKNEYERLEKEGFEVLFYEALHNIDSLQMYQEYGKSGWVRKLGIETKEVLFPAIVKTVTLAWYQAIVMSKEKLHANTNR